MYYTVSLHLVSNRGMSHRLIDADAVTSLVLHQWLRCVVSACAHDFVLPLHKVLRLGTAAWTCSAFLAGAARRGTGQRF